MTMLAYIKLHSVIPSSGINGPGKRLVVFFQGCNRGCDGCFNPATHSHEHGVNSTAKDIINDNISSSIEGITVSGGEPFLQPQGLKELLTIARQYRLSTIVYTGFKIEDIKNKKELNEVLPYIDVLIDGPFVKELKERTLLARGSTNQRLHLLTDTYKTEDFIMRGSVEIIISNNGEVIRSGFSEVGGAATEQP
jgi:anaerobic ribonucleoside-triphosphate reductase activating protein